MVVTLKGNFVENTEIKKKDNTSIPCAIILSGKETVQVNNCKFGPEVKRFQDVSIDVDIKNTQYGIYITPVK